MAHFSDRPVPAPPPPPIDDMPDGQWDHYDDSTLPPEPPVAPMPPPPGRQYYGYRQPPTWQHASIAGVDGLGGVFSTSPSALAGLAHVAAGAGLGYLFTKNWQGATAGGLAVLGAGQLPSFSDSKRLLFGLACLGGAYYLIRREVALPFFAAPNEDGADEEEEFEEVPDEDEEEDAVAAPQKPSVNTPWMSKKNAEAAPFEQQNPFTANAKKPGRRK